MISREGIVIKTIKYQETSKIVYVLCEDGLVSLLMRNANNFKSKNYSYSQELTEIGFDYSEKNNFKIMTSGKVLNNFTKIKEDPNKIFNVISILEIIYTLSDHVNDNKILYNFLKTILERINDSNLEYYYLIFKIKLLYLLGVAPNLISCKKCHKKENLISLELNSGSSLCKDCFELTENSLQGSSYEVLRFLYLTKLEFLTDEVLNKLPDCYKKIDDFLDKYYEHYLGYKSKTKKILNKIVNS